MKSSKVVTCGRDTTPPISMFIESPTIYADVGKIKL